LRSLPAILVSPVTTANTPSAMALSNAIMRMAITRAAPRSPWLVLADRKSVTADKLPQDVCIVFFLVSEKLKCITEQ
jgi:hypothetical protein